MYMYLRYLLSLLLCSWLVTCFGQFKVHWSKRISNPANYYADIRAGVVVNNNAIMVGGVNSNFYLTEINPEGVVFNEKMYDAGGRIEVARDIAFAENQFAIAGFILNRDNDYRAVLTDRNGNFQKDIILYEEGYQQLWQITAVDDGYILGGITDKGGQRFYGRPFDFLDMELLKMDRSGNIVWRKTIGGPADDMITDLAPLPNGDFVVLGLYKEDFNINQKGYIARLNSEGDIIWEKLLGGTGLDGSSYGALHVDEFGDIYAIVDAGSGPGGNKTVPNYGQTDTWILKFDHDGNIIWQQNYGGTLSEKGNTMTTLPDGTLLVGTISGSGPSGNKFARNIGQNDIWLKILDKSNGEIITESVLGGSRKDDIYVAMASKCGVYLGGVTLSEDGDFNQSMGQRLQDGFIMKIGNDFTLQLPPDTSVCSAEELVLEPIIGDTCYRCSYTWQDGYSELNRTYLLEKDSLMVLTVRDSVFNCSNEEKVYFSLRQSPSTTLSDTTVVICDDEPVQLLAGGEADRFKWSGQGFTSDEAEVTLGKPGSYSFTAENYNGCVNGPYAISVLEGPSPTFNLLDSAVFCGPISTIMQDVSITNGTYRWNDNDTSAVKYFDTPGVYWVDVTNEYGCIARDSMHLVQHIKPDLSSIQDTFICSGDTLELGADIKALSKRWQGTIESDMYSVNSPGKYTLTAWNEPSCIDSVAFEIREVQKPVLQLTGDSVVCDTILPFIRSADTIAVWSTGDVGTSIEVKKEGVYAATVTNREGCSVQDSFFIELALTPKIEKLKDTVVCDNQPIFLQPAANASGFEWSTGEQSSGISISEAGRYSLRAWNNPLCVDTSYVQVEVDFTPSLELLSDTSICTSSFPFAIEAKSNAATFSWSTGDTTSIINIDAEGWYNVHVYSEKGCHQSDRVQVQELSSPKLDEVGDTILCGEATAFFDLTNKADSIRWSDNYTGAARDISDAGMYQVFAQNLNGCQDTVSFMVGRANIPEIDLGENASLCAGDSLLVGLEFRQGYTYRWQDGDSLSQKHIVDAGLYILQVESDKQCQAADSLMVDVKTQPTIEPIADREVCQNDSLMLEAWANSCESCEFEWSFTSESSRRVSYKADTTQLVKVIAKARNGCRAEQNFLVKTVPKPTIKLIADTIACAETEHRIIFAHNLKDNRYNIVFNIGKQDIVLENRYEYNFTPKNNYTLYLRSVKTFGESIECQAFYKDSLNITYQPIAYREDTVFLCPGEFININGSETREPGFYTNQIRSEDGCLIESSEITVQTDDKELLLDIPEVKKEGQELKIVLNNSHEFSDIQWEGPQGMCKECSEYTFNAKGAMEWNLTAIDENDCLYEKQLELLTPWKKDVYIPNVISRKSERNRSLKLFFTERVARIEDFKIFDRWGSMIYEQKDDLPQHIEWDGIYKLNTMKPEVVICQFVAVYNDGSKELFVQDVTVLN